MNPYGITQEYASDHVSLLTQREREVAEQIAMGVKRVEVGTRLGMSPRTVDVHLDRIREKWGVETHGIGRIWFAALAAVPESAGAQ